MKNGVCYSGVDNFIISFFFQFTDLSNYRFVGYGLKFVENSGSLKSFNKACYFIVILY
ncbi:hypothetical protein Xszus_03149 [Xenorhabdus szentirmaii]|uniref:Uncharacterized protein n=1 Tax=Xenorhabdus szentirmaii DSM 16338 TaxID=1427518 RepID=W1J5C4_9GAMM|nr:hypothetical protein Xsze_01062 [Xenorhabdus szentirmaii DSM 16338]PHM43361.1 hypothetical protein Xszus_03149 [Xenorhabdus szentirmaii]CDL85056.1 hypothetical protein XSR1_60101 [Xenorhabdus szentirmaii DSM 16338]